MTEPIHKDLAAGRWFSLSFAEQMGNIGSEISRASHRQATDQVLFDCAVVRALELFNLTLIDPRWRARASEIARAREVFSDAVLGGTEYGTHLPDLQNYFDQFGILARSRV